MPGRSFWDRMPGPAASLRRAFPALVALLASACASPGPQAALTIVPAVAAISPGETLALAADVHGSDEPVVWAVIEPGGGTIDERGRYTAPNAEGTFHVTAWVGTADTLRTAEIRVRNAAFARAP